jgi:site-specific recombinase XerD
MTRSKHARIGPAAPTIDEMWSSFEIRLQAEGKSPRTIYSYGLSVRLLSEFLDGRGHDGTVVVSADAIAAFIAEQSTRRVVTDNLGRPHHGGSPATASVRYKALQQFFRYVVREGELPADPMAGMRAPKVVSDLPAIVPDDVLTRLLKTRERSATLWDRRDVALLRVFLDTGCRLSEVTNLRQENIDIRGRVLVVLGKGNKFRVVPFGAKTAQALDRYLRQLRRERFTAYGDDNRLWWGRQGPMTTSGITNAVHSMCDDAKVPRIHVHQLRHTMAHHFLAAGGSETDLMSNAGWTSRSMIEVYARSTRAERGIAAGHRLGLGDRV